MSRNQRKTAAEPARPRFRKLLGWTVLLALVFTAGLITGERLVRQESFKPLVSVSSRPPAVVNAPDEASPKQPSLTPAPIQEGDSEQKEPSDFSFFDRLTSGEKPILERRAAQSVRDRNGQPTPARAGDDGDPVDTATQAGPLPARYTLQIAAHPDMKSASQHMARLRRMGLDPHVISASIPDQGNFYRVRLGKFTSMEEARHFQAELKRKNSLNAFVSPL